MPSADAIFAALAQRRATVHALRALARLSYSAPEESHKARQLLVAERPDRLRMEILSPFGTVFVLTTGGGTLTAWSREESTVYRGLASPENLERYAQLEVPVPVAVDLLLGTPPLRAAADSVVSADAAAVQLWQDVGDGIRVGWFNDRLEPLRYEQRDAGGHVHLRVSFDAYTAVNGVTVPLQLGIELPLMQRRLDLTLSEPEINPHLATSVFALDTPPGSRLVDLDQATP